MLRVSSLGLTRYHDTSRLLPCHLRRSSSKVALHGMLETATCHRNVSNGEDSSGPPDDRSSGTYGRVQNPSPAGTPMGRQRAVIAPLRFRNTGNKIIGRIVDGKIVPLEKNPRVGTAWTVQPQSYLPDQATLLHTPHDDARYPAGTRPSGEREHLENLMATTASTVDGTTNLLEKKPHGGAVWTVQPQSHLPDQSAPLHTPSLDNARYLAGSAHTPGEREDLENTMATTASAEEAWSAYRALMALPRKLHSPPVPYSHLHRLARLQASSRPRTRLLFFRLLSVLSTLHVTGGRVQLWEWNALLDCAGRGWRKTRVEDFKAALEVFEDLVAQRGPGSRFSAGDSVHPVQADSGVRETVRPDIVTYTTLLNIAGRTLNEAILRQATSLLEASGLPPNRITHLVLVRYFTRKNQLSGVRATLFKMKEQGFEMGLDGLNACAWAYARSGRLDVASTVYRVLRHNLVPEDEVGEDELKGAVKRLSVTDGLTIPLDMAPDNTTFYILIQAFAYHGDLVGCLRIFMDMITLSGTNASPHHHGPPNIPDISSPTLPAFRAIFLGFARHGMPPAYLKNAGPLTRRLTSSAWTHDNLDALYHSFLALPHDVRPSDKTVYWVMKAFATTSGNDLKKLRRVWKELEQRFGDRWGRSGRLARFKQAIYESAKK